MRSKKLNNDLHLPVLCFHINTSEYWTKRFRSEKEESVIVVKLMRRQNTKEILKEKPSKKKENESEIFIPLGFSFTAAVPKVLEISRPTMGRSEIFEIQHWLCLEAKVFFAMENDAEISLHTSTNAREISATSSFRTGTVWRQGPSSR